MNSAERKWTRRGAFVLVALAGLAGGFLLRGPGGGPAGEPRPETPDAASQPQVWTCSMHPQIHSPTPGECPLCGMDLIPVSSAGEHALAGLRELAVSEDERELMRVRSVPVERRLVESEVRLVGKIAYDDTRVRHLTAWVPGRIDRLYVDYVGVSVKAGDHMVYLYSPEVYAAQEELLQAKAAMARLEASGMSTLRASTEATVEASRERLRLWGLTQEQVEEIEARGKASAHTTIYAPSGGVVIEKNAQEGMYLTTGTRIFTIADLSRVWVVLDAYESDISWVRYGQRVSFEAEAYPDEHFEGSISFIDPSLDPVTRTVKVRVVAENPDGKLKPEMFVRATIRAKVAASGRVMDASLAGKWISPMHPEIVKDEPGTCDVCGMALVPAESLGFLSEEAAREETPLVIPVSAALVTGRRAVVYVEVPGTEQPTYEGREVVLGPRAGEYYVVRHGLEEGELVVVEGNFKIDSALQIRAKPSMMSPDWGQTAPTEHDHGASSPHGSTGTAADAEGETSSLTPRARERLATLVELARAAQRAEDLAAAQAALARVDDAAAQVDASLHAPRWCAIWKEARMRLSNDAFEGRNARSMTEARLALDSLGKTTELVTRAFGLAEELAGGRVPERAPQAAGDRHGH